MKGRKAWGQGSPNEGDDLNRCFVRDGCRNPLAEKGKTPLLSSKQPHLQALIFSFLSMSLCVLRELETLPFLKNSHPKGHLWKEADEQSAQDYLVTLSPEAFFLSATKWKTHDHWLPLLNVSQYKFISGCFYFWVRQRPTREPWETDDAIFTLLRCCLLHSVSDGQTTKMSSQLSSCY